MATFEHNLHPNCYHPSKALWKKIGQAAQQISQGGCKPEAKDVQTSLQIQFLHKQNHQVAGGNRIGPDGIEKNQQSDQRGQCSYQIRSGSGQYKYFNDSRIKMVESVFVSPQAEQNVEKQQKGFHRLCPACLSAVKPILNRIQKQTAAMIQDYSQLSIQIEDCIKIYSQQLSLSINLVNSRIDNLLDKNIRDAGPPTTNSRPKPEVLFDRIDNLTPHSSDLSPIKMPGQAAVILNDSPLSLSTSDKQQNKVKALSQNRGSDSRLQCPASFETGNPEATSLDHRFMSGSQKPPQRSPRKCSEIRTLRSKITLLKSKLRQASENLPE